MQIQTLLSRSSPRPPTVRSPGRRLLSHASGLNREDEPALPDLRSGRKLWAVSRTIQIAPVGYNDDVLTHTLVLAFRIIEDCVKLAQLGRDALGPRARSRRLIES